MKQTIYGVIKAVTPVKQFTKRNGEDNVKCVFHIMALHDETHPQELAVTACGGLTLYAAAVGSPVQVEYVVRVFEFMKDGQPCFGNDVYATDIQAWQP